MSDATNAKFALVERYLMIPDCGPCEDDEHDDCPRPRDSVQVAVDDWAPVCCCTDHPLIALLSEVSEALSAMCLASNTYEWQQAKRTAVDLLEALSYAPVAAGGDTYIRTDTK